uniref:Uncharacterized protein n=1 Tax=Cliftonaea pectinata TaxID=2007206 RepID=A0A1Z1MQK4_9FLOR|nr:hypothetical protein [Cliftonaea pectinata]ARW68041.1 hypothetical protein [Cliftonaea pectinata]
MYINKTLKYITVYTIFFTFLFILPYINMNYVYHHFYCIYISLIILTYLFYYTNIKKVTIYILIYVSYIISYSFIYQETFKNHYIYNSNNLELKIPYITSLLKVPNNHMKWKLYINYFYYILPIYIQRIFIINIVNFILVSIFFIFTQSEILIDIFYFFISNISILIKNVFNRYFFILILVLQIIEEINRSLKNLNTSIKIKYYDLNFNRLLFLLSKLNLIIILTNIYLENISEYMLNISCLLWNKKISTKNIYVK